MINPTTSKPLKPKATATWLIENTVLTFEQIADSCGLNILEVEALADDSSPGAIRGENPVVSGQLTTQELERCVNDETARLQFQTFANVVPSRKRKESHYLPRARRQDRPDGIAWLLKYYPDLSDSQICRLIHTTSKTVQAIRGKTHHNSPQIKPRDPVFLELCTKEQLDKAIETLIKKTPEEGDVEQQSHERPSLH